MHPYYEKSMSTNFPGFPHMISFVALSRAIGNRWGNPYVSHMIKHAAGWESNGKSMGIDFTAFSDLVNFA